MNIGIDARALGGRLTGDRTYWRGLVSGLTQIDQVNNYFLFLRSPLIGEDVIDELPANFVFVVVPAASDRIWSMITFGQAARRHRVDLAHVQYTIPPGLSCKVVTTVHDISFRLFPALFSTKDRTLLNITVPMALKRADAVITVSGSSRQDILSAYPFVPSAKVVATHLGVGPNFQAMSVAEVSDGKAYLAEKYGVSGKFVLSVGVLQPRKNLPILIDAFVKAKKREEFEHRLVVVGKVGWLSSETEGAIADAGSAVQMIGYVPDNDLPILYGCADIMAYPSLYEGFGLPVLEAMASGCPVIASNNSSLPEVAGNAGILVGARDRAAWEDALIRLIGSEAERTSLRAAGLKQASGFSWVKTAQQTLAVYEEVLSNL